MERLEFTVEASDIRVLDKRSKRSKTVVSPVLYITSDNILFEQGPSNDRRQLPVLPQNVKMRLPFAKTTEICFKWRGEREIVFARIPNKAARLIGRAPIKKRKCM